MDLISCEKCFMTEPSSENKACLSTSFLCRAPAGPRSLCGAIAQGWSWGISITVASKTLCWVIHDEVAGLYSDKHTHTFKHTYVHMHTPMHMHTYILLTYLHKQLRTGMQSKRTWTLGSRAGAFSCGPPWHFWMGWLCFSFLLFLISQSSCPKSH